MEVFDRIALEKVTLSGKPPQYALGISTYDEHNLAYCLAMKTNGSTLIILHKTMRDRVEFDTETMNLAKYFNAVILKEGE